MSKIALTPNASGTGTFTLAAPNSNTSRTITLPDEAGEVLVNTATGINVTGTVTADGLTVNGNNNIQINRDGVSSAKVFWNRGATQDAAIELNASEDLSISVDDAGLGGKHLNLINNNKLGFRLTSGGDISFYEDTGTTPKMVWSASAEQLAVTNDFDSTALKITKGNNSGNALEIFNSGSSRSLQIDHNVDNSGVVDDIVRIRSNGTTVFEIENSGNVGIGTSSPTTKLQSKGGSISTPTDNAGFIANASASFVVDHANDYGLYTGYVASANDAIGIAATRTLGSALPLSLQPFGGNVLVGTTSSLFSGNHKLEIYTSNATGDSGIVIKHRDATGVSVVNAQLFVNNAGSTVGSIKMNSSSTSYNTSSDYRLKTDAQPMTGASARVQALNPVNFEWIANGTRVDGFLAHEAQEIVPEAVTGTKDAMRDEEYEVTPAVYEDVVIPAVLDEDGNELEAERTEQQLVTEAVMGTRSVPDYQGIDQSKLVPLLTAALQEALTEISDLKARVTALEAV